jgi:hypothetical protein
MAVRLARDSGAKVCIVVRPDVRIVVPHTPVSALATVSAGTTRVTGVVPVTRSAPPRWRPALPQQSIRQATTLTPPTAATTATLVRARIVVPASSTLLRCRRHGSVLATSQSQRATRRDGGRNIPPVTNIPVVTSLRAMRATTARSATRCWISAAIEGHGRAEIGSTRGGSLCRACAAFHHPQASAARSRAAGVAAERVAWFLTSDERRSRSSRFETSGSSGGHDRRKATYGSHHT